MALANFFDKTAFGLSQLMNQFDYTGFADLLSSHCIQIRFPGKLSRQKEAMMTLDLLTRLVSRLSPCLEFRCTGKNETAFTEKLEQLALSINPDINLSGAEKPTIIVNVGAVEKAGGDCPEFFVGSDRWLGLFSSSGPLGSGNSSNVFGAGFAACIGAANVFRTIFKKQLPFTDIDKELVFSVFDYSMGEKASQGPELAPVELNSAIVGLGAVGNGTVWALNNTDITGHLYLIDKEPIERSNLQRYVLASQKDIGELKVKVMQGHLAGKPLVAEGFPETWEEFLKSRKDWKMETVAVGVDSANTRISIQASLPMRIINAWTQMEQIGVSRHTDFLNRACLACLYLPAVQRKSLSEEIAENLNLAPFERSTIRKYLADKLPIDRQLIQLISAENKISEETLVPYLGKSLEVFHSEVVCGGIFMRLTGNTAKDETIYVPSAFESALVGILLAAEMVIDAGNLRTIPIPNVTKLNLIRPLTRPVTEFASKHPGGRCICQDPIFKKVYEQKWQTR